MRWTTTSSTGAFRARQCETSWYRSALLAFLLTLLNLNEGQVHPEADRLLFSYLNYHFNYHLSTLIYDIFDFSNENNNKPANIIHWHGSPTKGAGQLPAGKGVRGGQKW